MRFKEKSMSLRKAFGRLLYTLYTVYYCIQCFALTILRKCWQYHFTETK